MMPGNPAWQYQPPAPVVDPDYEQRYDAPCDLGCGEEIPWLSQANGSTLLLCVPDPGHVCGEQQQAVVAEVVPVGRHRRRWLR